MATFWRAEWDIHWTLAWILANWKNEIKMEKKEQEWPHRRECVTPSLSSFKSSLLCLNDGQLCFFIFWKGQPILICKSSSPRLQTLLISPGNFLLDGWSPEPKTPVWSSEVGEKKSSYGWLWEPAPTLKSSLVFMKFAFLATAVQKKGKNTVNWPLRVKPLWVTSVLSPGVRRPC